MANNVTIKDAFGNNVVLKTTETGGVHTPSYNNDAYPTDPFGQNADAAVTGDNPGSMSAKLRGLNKHAYERMPASLGQKAMAASLPVVIASDQAAHPVSLAAGSNKVGKVQIRNAADSADVDPLAEGTFAGRVGEVQASPTQYTVLGRLKDLLTGIALAGGTNRIGKVILRNGADSADVDPPASAQLPAALTGSGNLKTAIQEALPAGANNVGSVNVAAVPANPYGANADAAALGDLAASISAKLRGLSKWAGERMPAALGRKTPAESLGVVLADDGPLPSTVSAANSTSTPLAGDGVFTGVSADALGCRQVAVSAFTDQASAANGLSLEFSSNGTNWDAKVQFSVPITAAGQARRYLLPVLARYFRLVYTNGAVAQTAFRLQTILLATRAGWETAFPADQASLPAVLTAGEAHLGEVGSKTVLAEQTPTVSTTPAYSVGDLVGGKLTFAGAARIAAGSGRVATVTVTDKGKQSQDLDLVLFDADPSGTTFTDNAAFAPADADLVKIAGVIPIREWGGFSDNSAGCARAVGLAFKLPAGTSLYGALVARGTPTFASTSDLSVRLAIEQN